MTAEKIKNRIAELCTFFGFEYKGVDCGIDPISHIEYHLCYDGNGIIVCSIDDVMTTPFVDGKCLNEIYNDIEITEW